MHVCTYIFRGFTGRTFAKSIVLMSSPTSLSVPLGQDKLKMYMNKQIIDGVDIPLNADYTRLKTFFSELFAGKLAGAR